MKINCISQYNHFPGSQDPNASKVYNDGKIWEYLQEGGQGASALLIEPRSLQPDIYSILETEWWRFKYIFTHDSQLLSIAPNAVTIYYWNEYEIHDEPKTKDISMICGSKTMCPLHNLRKLLAEIIQDKVDILGDWKGGSRCSIAEAYANYKFTVVIENYLDDYWFTEKLLNAFASKTVPIYLGARKIDNFFNSYGIIRMDSLWDIPEMIECMKHIGLNHLYEMRRDAIEQNFELVKQYKNFEDYFVRKFAEDKAP